jgi:hypothetical protein
MIVILVTDLLVDGHTVTSVTSSLRVRELHAPTTRREEPMTAILAIRSFWQQPSACNPYVTADRAVRKVRQERYYQIDTARRFWACPF